jgi:hypothetical protein
MFLLCYLFFGFAFAEWWSKKVPVNTNPSFFACLGDTIGFLLALWMWPLVLALYLIRKLIRMCKR